ncbi:LOW QUALITY PROTEIN: uncharacterized protein [Drosophila tropicalis]|uniref:LOW QUALITY PROTEIN: uncharacterized protein n=1 Tax=Drosophila tropicalis TaxID=46794 RepID=UPI0035AB99AC
MAYKWVQSSAYSSIPANAVVGGNDEDGAMIYVGRAEHEGDMLVCKVVPSKQLGFVSQRGEALPKDIFEVLCGLNLTWRKCYDHKIPETAVLCGRTSLDQPVYIGRGHYEGHLIIGKISSVHRALFIAYRGAERRLDSYEILLDENAPSMAGWQLPPPPEDLEKAPLTPPPPPSPPAPALEVAEKPFRYPHPLEMSAMPFPMHDRPPVYTPHPDPLPAPPATPAEILPQRVQPVLVLPPLPAPEPVAVAVPVPPPSYTAATVAPGPSSAFTPADTYKPPMMGGAYGSSYTPAEYAGPSSSYAGGYDYNYDCWLNVGPGYFYSPDAVVGGHDSCMSQLLIGRAYYAGGPIPGKADPSQGYCFITYNGMEIAESSYEVLMGQGKYHWVPGYDGSIAPGAVEAGRASNGGPLYIGRAHYCGTLTPGKIQQSHRCLQIPFGGQEVRISNYEVLVRSDLYHRQQAISLVY